MEPRRTFWQHIELMREQEKRLQNRLRAKYPHKIGMNTFGRLAHNLDMILFPTRNGCTRPRLISYIHFSIKSTKVPH